jgi:thioredoxin-related protein
MRIILTLLVALLFAGLTLRIQDTKELKWHSFTDGLKIAKAEKKKVLIDVYTDWCEWCKKMDEEVYANSTVKKYLASKFVLVKLNAESENKHIFQGREYSEMELAYIFGVEGFPTTIFIREDMQPITAVPGYFPADVFMTILTFIGDDYYMKMTFDDYLKELGYYKK